MKKRVNKKNSNSIFLVIVILIIIIILLIGIFLIYKIAQANSNTNANSEGSLPTLGIHNNNNNNQEIGIFSGGSGTPSDPYQISTCQELQNINNDLTANYILTGNIDCSFDTQNPLGKLYNNGKGFEPIGNCILNNAQYCYSYLSFTGTFDGNNHYINGLLINNSFVGLFGFNNGTIKNTGLINIIYTYTFISGGLVGVNYGNVENSYATGTINIINVYAVSGNVGGLVGDNYRIIDNSFADVYATAGSGSGQFTYGGVAGGLAGINLGNISSSFAKGNINVKGDGGGLVGDNNGFIEDCYATGNILSIGNAGGLVGAGSMYVPNCISNSYSTGNVDGYSAGGLEGIGRCIKNSFTTSSVNMASSGKYRGGLVGLDYFGTDRITNSFWDHESNSPTNCFLDINEVPGDEGCTKIESDKSYFYNINSGPINNWDFANNWDDSNNGKNYPKLKWESNLNICNNDGTCNNNENCMICTDCACTNDKVCQPDNPSSDSSGCACKSNWVCTDWSLCSGWTQNRTCNDINNCGNNYNKPDETRNCEGTGICLDFDNDNKVGDKELLDTIQRWVNGN